MFVAQEIGGTNLWWTTFTGCTGEQIRTGHILGLIMCIECMEWEYCGYWDMLDHLLDILIIYNVFTAGYIHNINLGDQDIVVNGVDCGLWIVEYCKISADPAYS
jgi:hypothetical protein